MSDRECPSCARPLDEHNRHVRLRLPDPVLAIPEPDRAARTWGGDTMLQVQDVGAFVRVLLPIKLTDGYTLTVGAWLAIDPAHLEHVWKIWDTPAYRALVLDGYLANAIEPWGDSLLGAAATARVQDETQLPWIVSSSHAGLDRLIRADWPHGPVLSAYASL
jgi:hypothetical protein